MLSPGMKTDQNQRSQMFYGHPEFPMQIYLDDFAKLPIGYIQWHWHPEAEFAVAIEGTVEYTTEKGIFHLHSGEGIFVNTGVLHQTKPVGGNALIYSCIFSPDIIAYGTENLIYQKYIQPIIGSEPMSCILLSPEYPWQRACLKNLSNMAVLDTDKVFGYEMALRNQLCEIWHLLAINCRPLYQDDRKIAGLRSLRMKTMLHFIQEHYGEKLQLADIAAAAHISVRECNRCFKNILKMRPIDYVNGYRISIAQKILADDAQNITAIAGICGFNDISYFEKVFRQSIGLTPLEYRKNIWKDTRNIKEQ